MNFQKKISIYIFILFALFAFDTVAAQELKWHTDITEAAHIAIDENKALLLFFTGSDWCGWCRKLQNEVLKTSEFSNWAAEKVILVELDFPRFTPQDENLRQQNLYIQQMFGVRGYPSIVFVTPQYTEDDKINLNLLGNLGYMAGGAETWLNAANGIIIK